MSTLENPMRVVAKFGPLPRDLNVKLGTDGFDITNALRRIVIHQGAGDGTTDYLPHVVLELSLAEVETEIEGQVDVFIPEPVRAALVRLGWLDPERASEVQHRAAAIVEAAYAYVDAPTEGHFDPEVEEENPAHVAYEHLAGCVERHRSYTAEVQQP